MDCHCVPCDMEVSSYSIFSGRNIMPLIGGYCDSINLYCNQRRAVEIIIAVNLEDFFWHATAGMVIKLT